MCELKRKYQYYEIEVIFENGEKESIDMLHSTSVDKSNFNEMRKVYNQIKEEYKDKPCVINFCGSSDDSSMNIIWTKEIKINNEDDTDVIKNNIPVNESLRELEKVINTINEREKFLINQTSLLNKKQDFLLHKIELSEDNVSLDEIVDTYKSIKSIRNKRRDVKNEKIILDNMNNNGFKSNTTQIINNMKTLYEREKITETAKNNAKELYNAPLDENQLIKTLIFRTHKERMSLIGQLQPKYNKVVINDEKKTISCFNFCKGR